MAMITEEAKPIPEKPLSRVNERQLVEAIDARIARSRRFRDDELRLRTTWEKCLRYYKGDQWPASMPAWVPRVGPNVCKMLVETNAAVLTSSRPEYDLRALSDSTEDKVQIVESVMKHMWDIRAFMLPIRAAIKGSGIYGTGFVKVRWDLDEDDVVYDYVPPFNIYPDTLASSIEDMRWMVHVTLFPIREIERQYGVKVQESNLSDVTTGEEQKAAQRAMDGLVRVYEYWFDRGRQVALIAGSKLLELKENPLGTFPFARFIDTDFENYFFGAGIIEDIMPAQREINERRAQIHAWARYNAWCKWRAGYDVDERQLTSNMPNTVVQGEHGSVEALQLPMMPPYLLMSPSALLQEMEMVTGITDITQGRRPPGLTANAALQTMISASQLRIQSKTAHMEQAIARLGYLTLEYVKMNYDDQRVLPFLDSDELIAFQQTDGMKGLRDLSVSIVVQPGSTLSHSEGAVLQLMRDLFINKAVDAQALLEAAKVPGWKKILARMQAKVPGFNGVSMGLTSPSTEGGMNPSGGGNGQMTPETMQLMQQMAQQQGGGMQ